MRASTCGGVQGQAPALTDGDPLTEHVAPRPPGLDLLLGVYTTHRCARIGRDPRGPAHRWSRPCLSAEMLALLDVRGARIRAELLTDVVPFDEAPHLFAELSAWRRHAITAVLRVPEPWGSHQGHPPVPPRNAPSLQRRRAPGVHDTWAGAAPSIGRSPDVSTSGRHAADPAHLTPRARLRRRAPGHSARRRVPLTRSSWGVRMCSATPGGASIRACSAASRAGRPGAGSTRTERTTSARLR